MILFYIQGIMVVTLSFGIFMTVRKKDWRMFWVFSFIQAGFLSGIAIPFLFRKLIEDNLDAIKIFPYLHAVRYVIYLMAILILLHMVMKKDSR